MIWVMIERIVHLTTLVLLIIMISIIFSNNKSTQEVGNFSIKLDSVKQDIYKVLNNNVEYFDARINKLAENQDSYQVGTDQRVYLLEQQIKLVQATNKNNNRIVNTNINTVGNVNN
jgi:cell shape-determining protein MreC